jgi:hypothetical protein
MVNYCRREDKAMRSEKPKKSEPGQTAANKAAGLELGANKEPLFTLFTPAGSGSTALNYLAQDPDLAEREAAVIFEAARKSKK